MQKAFELLDRRIQKFIWLEKWASLRPIQEMAIPVVVQGDKDTIIAASTAAGKTEAAFFPALTLLAQQPGLIVYISPLKALINDQWGRLQLLCEQLDIPVYPWHGDIPAASKARFMQQPEGVLLITPESIEAMLCTKGTQLKRIFGNTRFFIIDELHAFIGSERGKQLQALMHRIDNAVGAPITRLGLSATLGDMSLAAEFLRPGCGDNVEILNAASTGNSLKIIVKGYEEPETVLLSADDDSTDDEFGEEFEGDSEQAILDYQRQQAKKAAQEEEAAQMQDATPAQRQVAEHMFKVLRGSNNLVFPNSRKAVELYTHLLNTMAARLKLPTEFWPHHGSLSKEIRAETEAALKQKTRPATAVCTNTLELGIDIGSVKSVNQVNSPPSVASVRQRLGRSGRRGEPAILRGYCIEDELTEKSDLDAQLRLNTVQVAAMVTLLTESWFEPPPAQGLHLSTLVQQILSATAQKNGMRIGPLYQLLCGPATPFAGLDKNDFAALIRHLGTQDLLVQESSGTLLHGKSGEAFVNDYKFYAAFASEEEYRIIAGGKPLGTLPVSQMIMQGQRILFAAKTWIVDNVNDTEKVIHLIKASGGAPPMFTTSGGHVHSTVRQRMREVLRSNHVIAFLDPTAQRFVEEARLNYQTLELDNKMMIDTERFMLLFTWLGDTTNAALVCMLRAAGMRAVYDGPVLYIEKTTGHSEDDVIKALHTAATVQMPSLEDMLPEPGKLKHEKWDWALPDDLLRKAYASIRLNLQEAQDWSASLSP